MPKLATIHNTNLVPHFLLLKGNFFDFGLQLPLRECRQTNFTRWMSSVQLNGDFRLAKTTNLFFSSSTSLGIVSDDPSATFEEIIIFSARILLLVSPSRPPSAESHQK